MRFYWGIGNIDCNESWSRGVYMVVKNIITLMVIFTTLMASGCGGGGGGGGATQQPGYGSMKVRVVDSGSGAPLEGATVRVSNKAANTDSGGACKLVDVTEGTTVVSVTRSGYTTSRVKHAIFKNTTGVQTIPLTQLSGPNEYDVIVVGAGTGGVSAAIQAARLGVRVALLEESDWIGGQMTAAAVTSMDEGADIPYMRAGIYKEFIDKIQAHYAMLNKSTATAYFTSNSIAFEPAVGQRKLYEIMHGVDLSGNDQRQAVLDLYLRTRVTDVQKTGTTLTGVVLSDGTRLSSSIVVEASEYGDILPLAGARYRVGNSTSDNVNPDSCVQFITYTAVIRKYLSGSLSELLLTAPPPDYQDMAVLFSKLVTNSGNFMSAIPVHFYYHNAWRSMPDSNNRSDYYAGTGMEEYISKTGVNWFNDFAVTARYIENPAYRKQMNCEAKLRTLQLLYYFQHNLGRSDWSVAIDEGFDTPYNREENSCANIPQVYKQLERNFPVMPYVREGRRAIGLYTLTAGDIKRDESTYVAVKKFPSSLAIGDYPVDLHGCSQPKDLDCGETASDIPPWGRRVFQVPFEVFIPEIVDGLVLAEKNLSVSRLVNGSIRLQPITMSTGQAAGVIAALSAQQRVQPRNLNPKAIQSVLLDAGCYLAPSNLSVSNPGWKEVQLKLLYGNGG